MKTKKSYRVIVTYNRGLTASYWIDAYNKKEALKIAKKNTKVEVEL